MMAKGVKRTMQASRIARRMKKMKMNTAHLWRLKGKKRLMVRKKMCSPRKKMIKKVKV